MNSAIAHPTVIHQLQQGKLAYGTTGDNAMESGADLVLSGSDSASVSEYVFLLLFGAIIIMAGFWDISRSGK